MCFDRASEESKKEGPGQMTYSSLQHRSFIQIQLCKWARSQNARHCSGGAFKELKVNDDREHS